MQKYGVTIKYTGSARNHSQEVEYYQEYCEYFKKHASIISDIAVEYDSHDRMHCHFTAEISNEVNRKKTFSRKGLHLKMVVIKDDENLIRWTRYINKIFTKHQTLDQIVYDHQQIQNMILYGDDPWSDDEL